MPPARAQFRNRTNSTEAEPKQKQRNGRVAASQRQPVKRTNLLTIEGVDYVVNDVSMFNMGNGEIVKHATNEKGVWTLKYEYPVFSWLHKISQHGWLLKEDNE